MVLMSSSVIRHSGNVENSLDARSFSGVSRRGLLVLRQRGSSMLPNSFLGRAMSIALRMTSGQIPCLMEVFHCMIVDHEREITKTNKMFGSLDTQTSTNIRSWLMFPSNDNSYSVYRKEHKPLKHKHLWQIAWNAKFWAMLVTPGHYTIAIRNHALRLSWLANLKVSKFLIFPHQTHQTLPKKLRANRQPTTFDNMYKYLKWLQNSVLIARGGPFLFGNRVCQFNVLFV